MKRTQLFCFAYAGGSAAIYYSWRKLVAAGIELVPIEYPGRGGRFTDPLTEHIDTMLQDVSKEVARRRDGSDFAFFGHSMGGLIAFELSHLFRQDYGVSPRHLFVSGKAAPHLALKRERPLHTLPDEQFLAEISALGGTPQEFFAHPELQSLFTPVLRADYKLFETYRFPEQRAPLDCQLTVFTGSEDGPITGELAEWQRHSSRPAVFYEFAGNHFFLHEHKEPMLHIMSKHIHGII